MSHKKMPLPTPNKGEEQNKFISRCMSNDMMQREYSDQKQRTAICFSQWRRAKKESLFSNVHGYETKQADEDLITGGYIATTHLDSGWFDEDKNIWVRDKIEKETLIKWAEEINQGLPRVNKVSIHHDRTPHVTGVGVKGSARVDLLPDKEYGLYVDTKLDKTREDFEDTKYRIENDFVDSYSIEFDTGLVSQGNYYDGAVNEIDRGNYLERHLMAGTLLQGWTLASQPMNENCVMIKEVLEEKKKVTNKFGIDVSEFGKEVHTMVEEKQEQEEVKKEEPEEGAPKEEAPKEEEPKEEEPKEEEPEEEKEFSKSDRALLQEVKKQRAKEAKEAEYKKISEKVMSEVKEKLGDIKIESKVMYNKGDVEKKEYAEFKEVINSKNELRADGSVKTTIPVNQQLKVAARFAEEKGMFNQAEWKTTKSVLDRSYVFSTNGNLLEFKGLGITTNQNTDTDYLLSAAELSDVFDPVIYSMLNQKTTTWNILQKDDYSNKGNNQVQFTCKTAANTTAAAYTGNAVTTGNVTRLKFMTKFKKYQVGVEVDGDMIAAARGGPIGDVFAQEVKDSTDDLLAVMNAALYAEVGLETAAGVIGFEYICDQAGNTTLYNLTRSTTNLLSAASASDIYINGNSADVTSDNMRKAIRQPIEEGGDAGNLVFFCSPIQYDKIKKLYDDLQRLVPTSMRYGFEGRMTFDGIPVFYDKDCNDDDIFLVDLETHRIAIWVPPTLEMLGKDADSQKGFIKTYWCTYNRAPRRMVMIYGNSTT